MVQFKKNTFLSEAKNSQLRHIAEEILQELNGDINNIHIPRVM